MRGEAGAEGAFSWKKLSVTATSRSGVVFTTRDLGCSFYFVYNSANDNFD